MRRPRVLSAGGLRAGLATGVIVGAVGAVGIVAPASAGTPGTGGGAVANGTITATASSGSTEMAGGGGNGAGTGSSGPASSGQAGGTPSTAPPSCIYIPAPAGVTAYLGPGAGGPGAWFVARCTSAPTPAALSFPVIWVPAAPVTSAATPATPPAPSVPDLVGRALAEAPLVQPTIEVDPPGDQVVFVPTWLWISPAEWHPVSVSAASGPVTATVTAVPSAVRWTFGDGQSLDCPGPGVAYDRRVAAAAQTTYCSHLWTTSSAAGNGGAFAVSATIEYRVTVTVTGAVGGTPDLGIHSGPSAQARVVVSEVEALGTNP